MREGERRSNENTHCTNAESPGESKPKLGFRNAGVRGFVFAILRLRHLSVTVINNADDECELDTSGDAFRSSAFSGTEIGNPGARSSHLLLAARPAPPPPPIFVMGSSSFPLNPTTLLVATR